MQIRHLNDEQYFQELAETTRKYILPFIQQQKPIVPGMRVLEIGCGVGGNLQAFLEKGCVIEGIDIAATRVDAARKFLNGKAENPDVTVSCQDFLKMPVPEHKFDLVFVHDVIEHIYDKHTFLEHLKSFLKPEGIAYFAFPAWQMPFGGHQQICHSKVASHLPFMHILPTPLYRGYLNTFEKNPETIRELLDIKRCKTPIERFQKIVRQHGYRVVRKQLYFINPHYETKFGLKPRKLWRWVGSVPYLRNFFSTSCFYLVKADESFSGQ